MIAYLASPYSHADPLTRGHRFQEVCKKAAELMRDGEYIFSPIAHSHPIARYGLPTTWKFWKQYDRAILSFCSKMYVLRLEGWKESEGIKEELRIAGEMGIPVEYLDP